MNYMLSALLLVVLILSISSLLTMIVCMLTAIPNFLPVFLIIAIVIFQFGAKADRNMEKKQLMFKKTAQKSKCKMIRKHVVRKFKRDFIIGVADFENDYKYFRYILEGRTFLDNINENNEFFAYILFDNGQIKDIEKADYVEQKNKNYNILIQIISLIFIFLTIMSFFFSDSLIVTFNRIIFVWGLISYTLIFVVNIIDCIIKLINKYLGKSYIMQLPAKIIGKISKKDENGNILGTYRLYEVKFNNEYHQFVGNKKFIEDLDLNQIVYIYGLKHKDELEFSDIKEELGKDLVPMLLVSIGMVVLMCIAFKKLW